MKILDCTLRDGGYYTNWDFDSKLVNDYLKLIKVLPIDIVEVGYRGNKKKESYLGEFYYLTKNNLKNIKSKILYSLLYAKYYFIKYWSWSWK